MPRPSLITIDGPAASGKSTLGELLARRLGYTFFDTGVMYRAVTLSALQQQLDCSDAGAMEHLARAIRIDVLSPTKTEDGGDGRPYTVLVDMQDVTWSIRSAEVDRHVSLVSRHAGVRTELIRQQRSIGQRGRMVMVGRDIGTVVFPDAPMKIYLETSLEERARRRLADLRSKDPKDPDPSLSLEQVEADLSRRDALDRHVLFPANDALIIHTDTCSPAEEVERIMSLFDGGNVPMSRPETPGG